MGPSSSGGPWACDSSAGGGNCSCTCFWGLPGGWLRLWKPQPKGHKARARVEFGKFNFASDFHHCRFYLRRLSTTIYNVLFVYAVLDFIPWYPICSSIPIFLFICDPGQFVPNSTLSQISFISICPLLLESWYLAVYLCPLNAVTDGQFRCVGISPSCAPPTSAAPEGPGIVARPSLPTLTQRNGSRSFFALAWVLSLPLQVAFD